jgi:hypothetical protein
MTCRLPPFARDFKVMSAVRASVIIAHRKPLDPARGQKALPHDLVEIAQHFGAGRQFKHALVEARLVLCPMSVGRAAAALGNGRYLQILFSNGSRAEAPRVSTLSGACVLCVLVRHLMG